MTKFLGLLICGSIVAIGVSLLTFFVVDIFQMLSVPAPNHSTLSTTVYGANAELRTVIHA